MKSALLFAALALAPPVTAPSPERDDETADRTVTRTHSLDVPDEIVPAVMPYMLCVIAKQGGPVHSDGKLLDLSDQPENCDILRSHAVENGADLYRAYGIGTTTEDRSARVLAFLKQFDELQNPSDHAAPELRKEPD